MTGVTCPDRKPVIVLGTLPTSKTGSSPVRQSVKVNGKWEKKQFSWPDEIDLYNIYTGGVVVSDQRTIAYVRLLEGVNLIDSWLMYEQSFIFAKHITRG